ncbi:hypothetical protein N7510_008981 [Penicillium lagena]|uniref:uncharacterized protein n=1 Tax=Penicillium lagena TaxID=94218 RepID=UPI00253F8E54|nr:uncharacterized protein N7510_008981 [Penicillium lagena]KAJ5606200.1 hypothetical protein N7510_008981 [Penicillium lagena]
MLDHIMSYYDVDSILTDAQKLPCTFELEVPGLGILEGNPGEDIKAGTRMDLPLWLGEMLSIGARLGTSRLVTLDMPDALSERVMNALKADPRTVDLRALAPHFYSLSERILEIFEEEEMVDVLSDTFKKRAAEIADHAHNPRGAMGEGVDFLRGLDETERQSQGNLRRVLLHGPLPIGDDGVNAPIIMDRKSHRRSSGALHQAAPPPAGIPVYHPQPAPQTRSVSNKCRSSHPPDRPQHPSLSRVKGRSNMYTPPRMSTEISWLNDQSPIGSGTRTPPQCKTPENGTPTLVNPASALLQDLLHEQRAHRGSRGPASVNWEDDNGPRTPKGAGVPDDSASEKARKISDALSASLRQPREMGMREMDQYISNINKLNFDLKLEVFHRAQQMGVMEKKLVRMQEMEDELERMHELEEEMEELRAVKKDNEGLRAANEQLRRELDKRDQAVTEAVELICQLEAKIEELETSGQSSRMSTVDVMDMPTPKAQDFVVDIPERTSSKRGQKKQQSIEPRQLTKAPSFLRDDHKSTATLRSLYAPETNGSTVSQLTKSESFQTLNDTAEPGSPRLSVLSECSELNPFDTPSRWDDFDQLEIPVRQEAALSSTASLDSNAPPMHREESKEEQIDRWMESRPDMSQTIIARRKNRKFSDASKTDNPSFESVFKSSRRPQPDTVFGGVRLPPTPDTMSTANARVHNGSNGSVAVDRSPQPEKTALFSGPRLQRPRSADALTTKHSFNSELTDSMQTNCSDTPRLGMTIAESPTIFTFNTVAAKASVLLGPGSPNNIQSFADSLHHRQGSKDSSKEEARPARATLKKRNPNPPKVATPERRPPQHDPSPPLTPQDWLAAASQSPQSRKERTHESQPQETQAGPARIVSRAAFHDARSIDSYPTESEASIIPTLDMHGLDMLQQPVPVSIPVPIAEPQKEQDPAPRRRLSFRPRFFNRSTGGGSRRLQSSPMGHDFMDDDPEDGAPAPNIPKTRNPPSAFRRPTSQLLMDHDGGQQSYTYSSSIPTTAEGFYQLGSKTIPRSFTESNNMAMASLHASNSTSNRPSTSHSMDHKRRTSSLSIFGWMKGVSGKRSEPATPITSADMKEPRTLSRLSAYENSDHPTSPSPSASPLVRTFSVESLDAPVVRPRPSSAATGQYEEQFRKPRYMGRRARRG